MGDINVNGSFTGHDNSAGSDRTRKLTIHKDEDGYAKTVDVPAAIWKELRLAAQGDDQAKFYVELQKLTIPGGWNPERLLGCWNGGLATWTERDD